MYIYNKIFILILYCNFRLCAIYNDAIRNDSKSSNAKSGQISSNTYPTMLQVPKRIDIKALLQVR